MKKEFLQEKELNINCSLAVNMKIRYNLFHEGKLNSRKGKYHENAYF